MTFFANSVQLCSLTAVTKCSSDFVKDEGSILIIVKLSKNYVYKCCSLVMCLPVQVEFLAP